MVDRAVIGALTVIVLCLMACGQTPAQVNNSGHEAYLGGDYAAALDAYHLAQERSPDSGAPYYNSGNVIYRMGEYGDSLQSYDESIRHAGGELRSRGFFNRGNASFQQQQYAQAVQAYKEVLRMNPDDQDAKHNLELALKQIPPMSRRKRKSRTNRSRKKSRMMKRRNSNRMRTRSRTSP